MKDTLDSKTEMFWKLDYEREEAKQEQNKENEQNYCYLTHHQGTLALPIST